MRKLKATKSRSPRCRRCNNPMEYRYANPPKKYFCMPCAVADAQAEMARLHREELVPVAGWAWDTDDGWRAAQMLPPPHIVGPVPCKIMIARKYVGMDGTD
jgi:hypothetical protein